MSASDQLSPIYAIDIRTLTRDAFAAATPLPDIHVPGGTIEQRVGALHLMMQAEPRLVRCAGGSEARSGQADENVIPSGEYWTLALPHRLVVHGPLLSISRANLSDDERMAAERQVLDSYYERYLAVPLPLEYLRAVRDRVEMAPNEKLPSWLDSAREDITSSTSVTAAAARRVEYRRDALLRGAAGRWHMDTVALAEVSTDLFLMAAAAHEDVKLCTGWKEDFNGSVSRALRSVDECGNTIFEEALPSLIRAVLTDDDFPDVEERARVKQFARSRRNVRSGPLIFGGATVTLPVRTALADPMVEAEVSPTDEPEPRAETAADTFRRIRSYIEERVIAFDASELALIATGHLLGIRQAPVLLTGPPSSGKTLIAVTVAAAIGEGYQLQSISDTTATGWEGASIASTLEVLEKQSKGRTRGVIILDGVDRARMLPNTSSNSLDAKFGLQSSLLGLLAGQPVTSSYDGRQIDTSGLLVVGTGTFSAVLRQDTPPWMAVDDGGLDSSEGHSDLTSERLTLAGFTPQFSSMWGYRLRVRPPGRDGAVELLRSGERAVLTRMAPLAEALGLRIVVADATLAYVADYWIRTRTDIRSAAEWLLSAARQKIIAALNSDAPGEIVITPDDVSLPRSLL